MRSKMAAQYFGILVEVENLHYVLQSHMGYRYFKNHWADISLVCTHLSTFYADIKYGIDNLNFEYF